MRLLFTLSSFPPCKFGGIASSMFSVIHGLNTSYEIKVITTDFKLPVESNTSTNRWTEYEGINVKYIKARTRLSFRFIFESFCQVLKADQVHLSGFFFSPSLVIVIMANLMGKTIVLSPHGELQKAALSYKSWKKTPYLRFFRFFRRRIIFRVTSEAEAIQIRHYFPDNKVFTISNFFVFEPPLFKLKKDQFVFLGRISNIKRIENLILGCSISKFFISSNFSLVLAGPLDEEFFAYETMLRELILSNNLDKNIRFAGEVISPQKEEILSESKAMFLVSDSENFGNVVLESLAQGTPVVASTGTPWMSLAVKNCGFWIDNSPESIATIIDEFILMNPKDYKIMSENAMTLSKDFSSETIVPKWISLINSL